MNKVIGISAFYHDSAVALVEDGIVTFAAQEERYSRIKNDAAFPSNALRELIKRTNPDQIDAVIFYEKPFLKFERILESYLHYSPQGFSSFNYSMPTWIKNKLFFKNELRKHLRKENFNITQKFELLFSDHHLSHAAFSFYTSSFDDATIISIDGVGEWTTTSIKKGLHSQIFSLQDQHYPNSVGLLYSSFTYFLGFSVNSGEYKVMGLAPYGNKQSSRYQHLYKLIKREMIKIFDDGSIQLNQKYFSYSTSLRMIKVKKWEKLLSVSIRATDAAISQEHCDLALAIQKIIEEIIFKLAVFARSLHNVENLCLAGGVALNCAANGRLLESGLFKKIHVPCSPGDSGSAIGAAFLASYNYFNVSRNLDNERNFSPYLGDDFGDINIKDALDQQSVAYEVLSEEVLVDAVAKALSLGKVIGWFQGRSEFGPRALGNRSILADSRSEHMRNRINSKVKGRESFRPFAPVILESEVSRYYSCSTHSPFMQFVFPLRDEHRIRLPQDFEDRSIQEKLALKISQFPATTHVDFSARVQTVSPNQNKKLWQLISSFHKLTGCPMILNTSFNVNNEPIVNTPGEALSCFRNSDMDILVLNNYIILK